jgi:microcystin-dependent protein
MTSGDPLGRRFDLGATGMTLYKWSQSAAADANADSTINWAEGQAPSSVNDSARAMMAATARYRDDIAGAIVTVGTSTAYAVSSFQVFDTLAHLNGQMIAFTPHTTNGATVTLSVDSLGAKPLRSAPNVELPAGVIIQGTPYTATYNNADGAFYLQGFLGNPYNIPIGAGVDFWGTTAPNSSFAFPYGQAISRATYSALFAIVGTAYGNGDGSTTFNLPDKRGRISVSLDTMGGTAAGRVTSAGGGIDGTTVGAAGGGQTYTMQRSDLPNVAPTFTGSPGTATSTSTNIAVNCSSPTSTGGSLVPLVGSVVANVTSSFTPAGTVQSLNGGVSQTVMRTLPPAIVVPYLIRII